MRKGMATELPRDTLGLLPRIMSSDWGGNMKIFSDAKTEGNVGKSPKWPQVEQEMKT